MLEKWQNLLEEMFDQMVEWRRHMHQYPELSFQEVETPKMIASILEGFGIDVRKNVGGRGIVATIKGGKPGKTIAFRADFDALPIQDEKDVPYKSKVDGIMHACGHDGHTATLLGVAKVLNDHRESLAGNIVLIHQHAEELSPGGAIAMIEDGCLDGVDYIFGTHLTTSAPTGMYLYRSGHTMGAADAFEIKVQGKGGHGSSPHQTIDAVAIGSQIVNQLQYIVSRRVDPQKSAVLSVGSFHAGKASNVIADTAVLTGTVRTFDKDVRKEIEAELKHIVKGVCDAFHASAEVIYKNGYPSVNNHEKETDVFKQVMKDEQIVEMTPIMGSEDFAYYLEEKPGTFFFTGAQNAEIGADAPHHHPMFDFDERAMLFAGKSFLKLAFHYMLEQTENKVEEIVVNNH
ncbi:M20 family metallopeptidase [Bacillus sp. PS06]|uniref:M20 family metallopeptidase n=1 Tax=Bacillus sp. PS06 TaxID=2764176 RepID=UPI0017828F60|nr:M20 family metallopeptidase [Bacillus sp. PS06]MBD8068451.1 amidohydrolase [Bacillus sp. PS06]